MHYRKYIIIFCLFSLPRLLFAQDITGLWKGTLYNDTIKKFLRYEVAISENRGKLSGYSHTFFILDDKEYYGVKKVKVKRDQDKVIVQDEKLIANNYPIAPAKGVHQLDILTLEIQDSIMILSGPFSTNRTKEYSSLTGTIRLQRKNDYRQSALVPHLEELGLVKQLSFVEPEILPVETTVTPTAIAIVPEIKKEKEKKPAKKITAVPVVAVAPVIAKAPVVAVAPVVPEKKPEPVVFTPAANVANRTIETVQSVYFSSDSLVLTLYDNGEVDGDTVSVLMNGKIIMPMQGLSTKAIRKTIYITPDMPDSLQLIMYAENLGSIPPNTGLLVVHDGEAVYEIRFSGDYKKNAAILFKRKKPAGK